MDMTGHHTIRLNFDSQYKITNAIAVFDDADHSGDQHTRRSLSSILVTLLGVLVDYKFEQQSCISLHSTDTEVQATFTGGKKACYFFELARFLDLPTAGDPITIYQDSEPCMYVSI